MKKFGKVYLVGAGPGDAGLLTVLGAKLLKRAQVVVVDALVNPALLRSTKAKIIFAGKRGPGAPAGSSADYSQIRINKLLVRLGRQGLCVVRLKGGDPFLFGRGSEELEALRKAKIPYEVVPGVTSALAVPAYAGIPVTDRRWASQVTIVTGYSQSGIDWKRISPKGTLIILMGVSRWPDLRKKLLSSGWDAKKPVAAIESGTTAKQRVILTTLGASADEFARKKLVAPSIVVVGEVASLHQALAWVGSERPLLGRRVVITRQWDQARDFMAQLEEKGAEVYVNPAIRLEAVTSRQPVPSPVRFDWVILLSRNAVDYFAARLGKNVRAMKKARIVAIGPRTAEAVRAHGWKVARLAADFNTFGVRRVLGDVKGKSILIPRVQDAPPTLSQMLKKDGARVTEIETYLSRPIPPTAAMRKTLLEGVDAITFTSGSTARYFFKYFNARERAALFKKASAFSIGPMTTAALRALGVSNVIESGVSTTEGMIDSLISVLGFSED